MYIKIIAELIIGNKLKIRTYGYKKEPKKINIGFTLSEILIAITIIGVIAAITIPLLASKYRKIQLKSQFTQAVSTIYQAIDKIKVDEGLDIYGTFASNSNSFPPVFRKYIQINTKSENWWSNIVDSHKTYSRSTIPQDYNIYHNVTHLNNGSTFMFWNSGYNDAGTRILLIIVDVNGIYRKPNRLGYDTFAFQICPDNTINPLRTNRWTKTGCANVFSECNINSGGPYNGLACTEKAMQDQKYFDNLP